MRVRLDQINVVVRDMAAMTEFYRRLGLDIGEPPPEWAPHHRSNDAVDGVRVDLDSEQFAPVWNRGWPGGAGVVLGFRTSSRDEVDQLYRELTEAGYVGQQPPYDAFWGARFAVLADPDGNAVGLMSPPEESRRSPSPPPPLPSAG